MAVTKYYDAQGKLYLTSRQPESQVMELIYNHRLQHGIHSVQIVDAEVTKLIFPGDGFALITDDELCEVANCHAPAEDAGLCPRHAKSGRYVSCDTCHIVEGFGALQMQGDDFGGWYIGDDGEEYCPDHRGDLPAGRHNPYATTLNNRD